MRVEQHNDPFEEHLAGALHQAGDTFGADPAALVAGGAARGRRARLRRRAALVGGVAGVAAIAVGASLLLPNGGSAERTNVAATRSAEPVETADDGDGGNSVGATGSARPTKKPGTGSGSGSGSISGSVSADEMVRMLTRLLPKGEVTPGTARGTGEDLPPVARVVFDDGKGAAAVSVLVERLRVPQGEVFEPMNHVMPCPETDLPHMDSCRIETLPDGSVLGLVQGYTYPDRREDTKMWSAELVTPAGQQVSVHEWNARAEKGEPVTRPEPPLSMKQLKRVATARQWRDVAELFPEPPATEVPEAPSGDGGKALLGALTDALPDRVEVVGSDHQDGFAYVVVDDGKGESYVQINLQSDMRDVADELYGPDAETLPDGTRVATYQGPGEKGGEGVVEWKVDTMREDGRRVVISAFNAAAQRGPQTRPEPALTMDELREIALDPKWNALG